MTVNRKGPFRLVYTALRPPLHWGTRWPLHEQARTILDVQPTDIRITLRGYDSGVARRQLRRLWERFWLLGPLDAPVFVYMKFGTYESIAMHREEDFIPDERPTTGWQPGEPSKWIVDPADLARY